MKIKANTIYFPSVVPTYNQSYVFAMKFWPFTNLSTNDTTAFKLDWRSVMSLVEELYSIFCRTIVQQYDRRKLDDGLGYRLLGWGNWKIRRFSKLVFEAKLTLCNTNYKLSSNYIKFALKSRMNWNDTY